MTEIITKSIGSLAKRIKTGSTPKTTEILNFEDANYSWFTPSDFSTSKLTLKNSSRMISEYAVSNSATLFEPLTILITCIGDIGNSGIIEKESSANQQITGVLVNESIINPYLFNYLIRHNKKVLQNKSNQAVVPILNNKNLKEIKLSFPKDLEIQKKIVTILDKAKSILNKREETIAKYDELLRATFLEMFGSPMERPNQWKINPINDCIEKITAGSSYGGENKKELENNEFGVLKISAVTKGIFNPDEYKAVKRDNIKKELVHPKKGDLLFSRANTLELVGATSIVDEDYDKLFLPDKIWKIDTNETLIKKVYLHYVLQNKDVRKSFLSIATGSSGSMLNISMAKFRNIRIPFPNIELQEQFEEKYSKYIEIRRKLNLSKEYFETLQKALSQLAFKGDLEFGKAIDLEVLLENDYDFFKVNSNTKSIRLLLERLDKSELNKNKFYEQEIYDKAKVFLFELLKEGKVKQVFDKKTNRVKLTV
ncbi:restriction endonuclease subunit S [Nonlabens marinus]|uniref:Type I restriction-modification system, specificity subunit S n=1 Tax=Nonlabens marinus S1-08 TaxID=1454201 RepID=W8VMV3_9FLAO|nr:restriction endonuclease subunit S [Nonlabens marinus]BAO54074.1 type I restriction-modification system, specificity subunit S [Nonlabens marinus S1-08]